MAKITISIVAQVLLINLFCLETSLGSSSCVKPNTIDYSLRQEYCDQPIFSALVPKSEEFMFVDNICYTYYPLPDDPNTFTVYQARVFCDGSFDIQTFIGSEFGLGQSIIAGPLGTIHDYFIGYAGCDAYILYRCTVFGGGPPLNYIAAITPKYQSLGLSCLRKVQEIISDAGLPEEVHHILPMKLPSRCVTQQLCTQPPNPFYNNLNSVAVY